MLCPLAPVDDLAQGHEQRLGLLVVGLARRRGVCDRVCDCLQLHDEAINVDGLRVRDRGHCGVGSRLRILGRFCERCRCRSKIGEQVAGRAVGVCIAEQLANERLLVT